MSKVLVVKAHPLATEQSRTLTILAQFMQVYQKQNPADEISWLDLYQSDLPEIDQELMTAWAALKEGLVSKRRSLGLIAIPTSS